ncbi:MAG: tRNA (guanosine(46)-N7)-methyltransferase TrmB [Prevotellaceae bacterium]|jgi:tRNA (guanine-N7-)-methyltransferase|nr:tRNA (guanosine(46)-N7)-methyltransferase TrmB [Prevotellaceae bacterium]
MGKNKYQRFIENETFTLLFQPPFEAVFQNDFHLKGHWREAFFKNTHPLILELGCGRGEYTVELARRYPQKNFIGIDRKGARLWRGAKTATEERLPNAAFIRTRIDFITSFFAPGEVDEIWLTFPDPQPTRPRKRLTGGRFLARYAQCLKAGGDVHLKTDNRALHEYTKAMAVHNGLPLHEAHSNIYGAAGVNDILFIRTHYEEFFLRQGFPITYCRFGLGGKTTFAEPSIA